MSVFKKLFPICLTILLMLPSVSSAASTATSTNSTTRAINVNINGSFISTDTNPFIQAGRVMVPVRTLASLGLNYSWDAKNHTATITNSSNEIFQMIQGERTAYKNGNPVQMDSEANNYNGRMMIPAKFVSEAFGYNVYYEKTRGILFIQSKNFAPDLNALNSSDLKQARLAAISLPITYSFKPDVGADSDKSQYYTYTFAASDATRYTYSNGTVTTVVEIKDGIAKAVWQFFEVNIPGYDTTTLGGNRPEYISDMYNDSFNYNNGTYMGNYKLSDGTVKTFKYKGLNYGDIIQSIPQ
ncbi:copper amine oxidase N-terminal domain-containing protein [Paenibacillus sp. KQZ6P-2]|uniref:Copper amine oxidase N-terminal domain-containing protein n=1 Tax=Paenibacillus mangrovi TaxID=2931978 RepID=A0A9X1WZW5_9BACL|nr:copper amine oxidase N-terminal domain-containing protein [Paenibacillus mangrovi]MCJ8015289.1 copper amine oxidase N-terminal domain-containing protein [Paenibacillus mangrovi]